MASGDIEDFRTSSNGVEIHVGLKLMGFARWQRGVIYDTAPSACILGQEREKSVHPLHETDSTEYS